MPSTLNHHVLLLGHQGMQASSTNHAAILMGDKSIVRPPVFFENGQAWDNLLDPSRKNIRCAAQQGHGGGSATWRAQTKGLKDFFFPDVEMETYLGQLAAYSQHASQLTKDADVWAGKP